MEFVDVNLPFEPLTLVPLSDLQLGAPGCDLKRFKHHIKKGLDKDAWFCLQGDMQDNASPSGRRKINQAALYDSTVKSLEQGIMDTHKQVLEILEPIRNRVLFVTEGHHKYVFEDGRDTDIMLAEFLGAPYVGTTTYCTLHFKRKGGATIVCNILAQHGEWSSVSGSLLTRKMESYLIPKWPEVDVFLLAHCHQAAVAKDEGMIRRGNDLRGKQRVVATTGGWLKGYVVGNKRGGKPEGTYVEKRMLPPNSVNGVNIEIIPVHTERHDYLQLEPTLK